MPMPSNEVWRNLLANEPIESFWDAPWLELWPFFIFDCGFPRKSVLANRKDRESDLLPNRAIENFWEAMWFELWPF